jgi:hypothetical protein
MIVDLIFWFFLCCIVFLFLSFPVAIVTRDELLQAERDEMREMLEKVEWVDGRCPWCMRRYEHREYSDTVTDYDGNSVCIRRATGEHKPYCRLAKVLGR